MQFFILALILLGACAPKEDPKCLDTEGVYLRCSTGSYCEEESFKGGACSEAVGGVKCCKPISLESYYDSQ
jgi:hypothetical protein